LELNWSPGKWKSCAAATKPLLCVELSSYPIITDIYMASHSINVSFAAGVEAYFDTAIVPLTQRGSGTPIPTQTYPRISPWEDSRWVLLLEKNLGLKQSCGGLLWKIHSCTTYCTTVPIIKEVENFLQLRILI
jgi:hypothetical protein